MSITEMELESELNTNARPEASIRSEPGPLPTSTRSFRVSEGASKKLTLLDPVLTDTRVRPSAVSATSRGRSPGATRVRSSTSPVVTSIAWIASSFGQATYSRRRR